MEIELSGLLAKYYALEPYDSKVQRALIQSVEEVCELSLTSDQIDVSTKGEVFLNVSPLMKHSLLSKQEEIRNRFAQKASNVHLRAIK